MMYQLSNTNCNGMEHILLLVINIWSKELTIGRALLDNNLVHSKQGSDSNRKISFGSLKSATEMQIIGSRRNINDVIGVNSLGTIGNI